jgi:outer membrane protein OmpU
MKKVLLASAALVASAGFAAADAVVGGYGFAGVKWDEASDDVTVAHKVRLTFTANVETDSGVMLTAFTRTNIADLGDGTAVTDLSDVWDKERVDIKAAGLSVRIGSTHGAAKTLARSAAFYGFDDGGVIAADNNTTPINDSGNNVLVQYTTGAVTVGVASTIDGVSQDIAVKYASGPLTVGAGYGVTDGASDDFWMAMVGYNFGQGEVKAGVGQDNAGMMEYNAILSYNVGAATTLAQTLNG